LLRGDGTMLTHFNLVYSISDILITLQKEISYDSPLHIDTSNTSTQSNTTKTSILQLEYSPTVMGEHFSRKPFTVASRMVQVGEGWGRSGWSQATAYGCREVTL